MKMIVLASTNPGKLKEFNHLFRDLGIQFISQAEFKVTDAEETASTFLENALLKARHAAEATGLPSVADDSGLCVPALQGAPGVYSARYAGDHDDAANNRKLIHEMQGLEGIARQAYFCCILVLIQHAKDPMPLVFQGQWWGEILTAPRGDHGFGYDPLFYIPELQQTAAELSLELKNQLSHRAKAVAAMRQYEQIA